MVRHQAICVTEPVEPLDRLFQYLEELLPIGIIEKDILVRVTAGSDVIHRAGYSIRNGRAINKEYTNQCWIARPDPAVLLNRANRVTRTAQWSRRGPPPSSHQLTRSWEAAGAGMTLGEYVSIPPVEPPPLPKQEGCSWVISGNTNWKLCDQGKCRLPPSGLAC